MLRLERPCDKYAQQVMAYRDAMLANGDSLDGCAGLEDVDTFEEWIRFDERLRQAYGDSYVPSEVFLAVRCADDRLVGIADYRHPLSPFLLAYGGNIGYSIHPAWRGRGYAREMLRLLLDVCKNSGEKRVLLTCDRENAASRRTIEANGGVLENEVPDEPGLGGSGVIRRYWIEL